jgi:hypothetical protein
MSLTDTFTSTGSKFFAHEEAMTNLRDGRGQPITTHVMLTDVCQHTCAFCSVQARAGDSLVFTDVQDYLRILMQYGLKSVILSGGGNPILYKCKQTGATFNDVVDWIHSAGLEIGLITNGMPLKYLPWYVGEKYAGLRRSWQVVKPETLDKLTWVRISMAGLDHDEREVYVPDIDPTKTTLGFSYVGHDIYKEPADPHHGKVSSPADLISGNKNRAPDWTFEERVEELIDQILGYVRRYNPKYVRLLPNCLEPELILCRCNRLQGMAGVINYLVNREVVFVQYKPPAAPKACYLGYIHPVLNCDGYVLPCDSCCLNESAGHKLGEAWRICHWSEVAKLYEQPVHSLIKDPKTLCPGCVFTHSNEILEGVVNGSADLTPLSVVPEHVNFV